MARSTVLILFALLLFMAPTYDSAWAQQRARTSVNCTFAGTYRINVAESDKLYSVVRGATSTVPFGDQQKFFMDMSTRLTPPDIVAIECNGSRVSIGSSRAARITYLADGRTRRERGASGKFVNSKVEMNRDSLTFVADGSGDDNVNVAFRGMGDDRLQVTRRIYAAQLPEPIIIKTVYDRVDERVDWADFTETTIARRNRTADSAAPRPPAADTPSSRGENARADDLREALDEWIAATNRRDIAAQMRFYVPVLKAYYLSRNTPQTAVRAEKHRVFSGARLVDIRASEPEIIFQDGGRTAIMRFTKEYKVADRSRTKSGVVVQELRWERSGDDWRIFSERDIRVIR